MKHHIVALMVMNYCICNLVNQAKITRLQTVHFKDSQENKAAFSLSDIKYQTLKLNFKSVINAESS